MSVSRSLTFLGTPWSVALSIIAVLATAAFFASWPGAAAAIGRRWEYSSSEARSGRDRGVLLNQPEWIEEFRPEEKPAIAVLWDASSSMDTRDARPASAAAAGAVDRGAKRSPAQGGIDLAKTPRADERGDPAVRRAEGGPRHRLERAAFTRARRSEPAGVVLASDGDWNEGQPPVLAAAALRMRGVPIFAVPVGSRTRLPDVELLSLDLPTFGVSGKSVRVPFSIESSMPREFTTTVTMRSSDGD